MSYPPLGITTGRIFETHEALTAWVAVRKDGQTPSIAFGPVYPAGRCAGLGVGVS